jgi:heat shock protein HslJ
MTRLLSIFALLLIGACSKQGSGVAPSANEAAPAPVESSAPAMPAAATKSPSLEGNWKVSMIGGRDVAGLGMTATLSGGKATISTGCFRRAWTYTQDRNVVAFTAAPSGSSNCAGQPSGDEEAANAAISDANMAIFAKDGKEASLSGTGGMLTLQRR